MGTTWRSRLIATLAISGLMVTARSVDAQSPGDADSITSPPAYAVRFEGDVRLVREGQSDRPEPGLPLEEGDRVTTALGRFEWRRDGAEAVFVDRHSDAELFGERLTRLNDGTLVVTLPVDPEAAPYRVDTPAASVRLSWPGRYRIVVRRENSTPETEVTTLRGGALVRNDAGSWPIGAGERTRVRIGAEPEPPRDVNVATLDAFDRWVDASPIGDLRGVDATALPEPLTGYGPILARHGSWGTDATYGAVWYPNVIPGWRPYAQGRWHRAPRFGQVWMGTDPWSWPTHHYGRWDMTAGGRWFWIPATQWAAAHVYWAVAPGYVAWSPLGWNGRPLVNFAVGLDAYGGGRYFDARGAYTARGIYDPWSVWTVVPSAAFGYRRPVADVQVYRSHFRAADRVPFVMTPYLSRSRGRPADGPEPRGGNRLVPRDDGRRFARPRPSSPSADGRRVPEQTPRPASPRAFGGPGGVDDPYARADRARQYDRWPGDRHDRAAVPDATPSAPRVFARPRGDVEATDAGAPRPPRSRQPRAFGPEERQPPASPPDGPSPGPRARPVEPPPQNRAPAPSGFRERAPRPGADAVPRSAAPGSQGRTTNGSGAPRSGSGGRAVSRGEGPPPSRD